MGYGVDAFSFHDGFSLMKHSIIRERGKQIMPVLAHYLQYGKAIAVECGEKAPGME
jgi:hypothetical protein